MKKIAIADITLREGACINNVTLNFKEKLEIAKLLDKLGADIIETAPIADEKTDTLVLRTLCPLLKTGILSCPVGLSEKEVEIAWNAISGASKPRLLVMAPVSAVQMEYISHKKPAKMLEAITQIVSKASSLCNDVEFAAIDATRAEPSFLAQAVKAALDAGAKTITLCDTSGTMLADEFKALIFNLKSAVPEISNAVLGVECSNAMEMANACIFACISAGVQLIKSNIGNISLPSTESVANAIKVKGNTLDIECGINTMAISQSIPQITRMVSGKAGISVSDPALNEKSDSGIILDISAEVSEVNKAVSLLGYDLSEDDSMKVYEAFKRVAAKKKTVNSKDLDSIVAAESNQVPPTFKVESYVINSGNIITSTASIALNKNGRVLQSVGAGDGPIDSAFNTLEQIIGHHYELDDFQIQSVTEGKEALGEALIKLRSNGKLYSGRGISTDIIGAAIHAYINALNKIVYEEK